MNPWPATLRVGTRGSDLARRQADRAAERLQALGIEPRIVIIQTRGDLDQRTEFGQLGAKGIFVKEIEDALLDGRIDVAVHSLKDLPTDLPPGLALAAVLERESPLDALVSRDGATLDRLPAGARVATGSLRRAVQVRALRPDVQIVPLRGNVPTRIEKIRRGEADATLLALAGLRRLGLESVAAEIFAPDRITPPMGQGILGLEARAGEWPTVWAALEDPLVRRMADAERAWLARIGGGCRTPAGVFAEPLPDGACRLTAMLAAPDGRGLMRQSVVVRADESPVDAARQLAAAMLERADPAVRAACRPEP